MAKLINISSNDPNGGFEKVALNSTVIVEGEFVSYSSGFVTKTGAGTKIIGQSRTSKTFDSDNQTVAKDVINYIPVYEGMIFKIAADAAITQADEGKFYNLNADQTVDIAVTGNTQYYVNTSDGGAAADPVLNYQVQLVKFVSQTASLYRVVV